jgi:1-acyl-sn-glycerol-3-phosphate acyltransferase
MIYSTVKILMRLSLKVYFRKQHIHGIDNIPENGPFIIVANHPSSFLDAVSIAVLINKKISFLAKATVFKNKLVAKVLYKLNLVPIYRAQDNRNQLKENTAVFQACYEKLGNNGVLMIFPEGTSENERRLRPIKTGAARIALGTVKAHNYKQEVKILPIGLNYTNSSKFRSELSVAFGKPIETKDYIESYKTNETKTTRDLTSKIEASIKDLIINIDNQEHDNLVEQLELIYKTELAPDSNLPIDISQNIIKGIKHYQEYKPKIFNDLKLKIENYFEKLSEAKITDKNVGQNNENASLFISGLKSVFKLLLGFPFWLAGIVHSYLPYILTRTTALSITKDEAFYGGLLMSLGSILFVFFYSLFILLSWIIFQNPVISLIYSVSLPVLGIFTVYYSRFARKFYYNWKFISNLFNKTGLISELIHEREIITNELELISKNLNEIEQI